MEKILSTILLIQNGDKPLIIIITKIHQLKYLSLEIIIVVKKNLLIILTLLILENSMKITKEY